MTGLMVCGGENLLAAPAHRAPGSEKPNPTSSASFRRGAASSASSETATLDPRFANRTPSPVIGTMDLPSDQRHKRIRNLRGLKTFVMTRKYRP